MCGMRITLQVGLALMKKMKHITLIIAALQKDVAWRYRIICGVILEMGLHNMIL